MWTNNKKQEEEKIVSWNLRRFWWVSMLWERAMDITWALHKVANVTVREMSRVCGEERHTRFVEGCVMLTRRCVKNVSEYQVTGASLTEGEFQDELRENQRNLIIFNANQKKTNEKF